MKILLVLDPQDMEWLARMLTQVRQDPSSEKVRELVPQAEEALRRLAQQSFDEGIRVATARAGKLP